MHRLLLAIYMLFGWQAPPQTHYIGTDEGGVIINYVAQYVSWEQAKDRVVLTGECDSACTILVGIIDDERMCATRNAEFGFHSAFVATGPFSLPKYSAHGTEMLWDFYTSHDRTVRVLERHGWKGPSEHPDLLMIDAQEILRPCTEKDLGG